MNIGTWKLYLYPRKERATRLQWWMGGIILPFIMGLMIGLLGIHSLPGIIDLILLYIYLLLSFKRSFDLNKWYYPLLYFLMPSFIIAILFALSELFPRIFPFFFYLTDPIAQGLATLLAISCFLMFFIKLGFYRGTKGPNKYGPDPLKNTSLESS